MKTYITRYENIKITVEAEQFREAVQPWPVDVIEVDKTGDRDQDQDCYIVATKNGKEYIHDGDFIVDGHYGREIISEQKFHSMFQIHEESVA